MARHETDSIISNVETISCTRADAIIFPCWVYTSPMSWSFRGLVLTVGMLCGLAPQIACFMPDQPLTQPEMDCCAKLANDCGQMNMSCCRPVVRTDVGIAAKA